MYSVKTGSLENGGLNMIETILSGLAVWFCYCFWRDSKRKKPIVPLGKLNIKEKKYDVRMAIEVIDVEGQSVRRVITDFKNKTEEYFNVKTK